MLPELEKPPISPLTPEEIQWVRLKMREEMYLSWAWARVRKYAPWVVTVGTVLSTAVAWLLTHSINISQKP